MGKSKNLQKSHHRDFLLRDRLSTVCAKSPVRSIKNRFKNLLLIRFWPWKGPIVVQIDKLVLSEVAIAIDDGLQPPGHRLHQVLCSVLLLTLPTMEWLSLCGAVHYITSQTKSFRLRMMKFGQQHPETQADTEKKTTGRCDTQWWCNYNIYTGQDFWRIL